jgi:sulfite reductase alpha subunit-like flavoprotein
VLILYGTQSGTAEDFAKKFSLICKAKNIPTVTVAGMYLQNKIYTLFYITRYSSLTIITITILFKDMATYDPENVSAESFVVFIMATYTNGM